MDQPTHPQGAAVCARIQAQAQVQVRVQVQGWTLTELLICMALVATLASIAIPSYLQQQRQARRTDAWGALQQLQVDQVRWRAQHERYADSLEALGWPQALSQRGHYSLRIAHADADAYTLEAWPVGAQSGDQRCAPLRLHWQGQGSITLSAGAATDGDPDRCWRQ
jgi:type IV pilus assembly protein PilE